MKTQQLKAISAGELCFGIMWNEFHRPFVDGKANRDNIEEAVTMGMLTKELGYVDQETVDLAIELIDDLIVQYKVQ